MIYTARAEWDETGWWVITVDGLPGANSQCRRLDQVEDNAKEIIELITGDGFPAVEVVWHVPGEVGALADKVSDLREQAENASSAAARATNHAVPRLRAVGMSYRDVGRVVGVSYQRAQQIDQNAS